MEKPIVSVIMTTYGHESFINQAINGVLMQDCDFDVELIISNDCSPDNTDEVVQNLLKTHPNSSWIKYIKHKNNIGMMPNLIHTLKECNGKYIAICEGDDYWTDCLKLQKQVGFLENNPDYCTIFTDYEVLYENSKKNVSAGLKEKFSKKSDFSLRDIIITNFIPTLTVLYRNNGILFPDNAEKLFPGDWPLHILNATKGKIKFLSTSSAVYRKHDNGICSSSNSIDNYKRYLVTLKIIKKWFKKDFKLQCYFMLAEARIYAGIVKNYMK